VHVSVWDRCDAQSSPERGYYYHPSRHSAGQPIVAGWAYQFIAELNFVRESWTAPVHVRRVRPGQDANEVAAEQVKAFLRLWPEEEEEEEEEERVAPLFVFDAGYYDPVRSCSRGSRRVSARSSSVCEQGGASTATRASRIRPHTLDALVATGRR